MNGITILRRQQVQAKTGLSRSSIYAFMSEKTFPACIKLGGDRAVGWLESEVDQWLREQVAKSRKVA